LNKGHYTLDRLLEDVFREKTLFSKKDRALLQALVYGVLRWRQRLDWIIDYFSKTRQNKIDPKVLNILRLGLFQIIYLDRIPVSAAVNTSVELTKTVAGPWVVRYVNGLLRNTVREYRHVTFPDVDKDPVKALAIKKSFPKWLIK
jgi:16S rRNA (cytosine967-C5)-methyltransferase